MFPQNNNSSSDFWGASFEKGFGDTQRCVRGRLAAMCTIQCCDFAAAGGREFKSATIDIVVITPLSDDGRSGEPALVRWNFQKARRLFIRSHNETLSVVRVRINNPDRSPLAIQRGDAAPNSIRVC
jgi:hypothetical protein